MRRTAARARVDETGLMVDVDGEEETDKVKLEDAALAICSCEAVYALSAIKDQLVIETAINGPESAKWKRVLEEELAQIEKLGTWELIEAPNNANIIPCRWVLHRK